MGQDREVLRSEGAVFERWRRIDGFVSFVGLLPWMLMLSSETGDGGLAVFARGGLRKTKKYRTATAKNRHAIATADPIMAAICESELPTSNSCGCDESDSDGFHLATGI